jgi:hypothetical protein
MTTIDRSNSLTDLAARIKTEHEIVEKHLRKGVERAVEAGKLLIEAKAQLKHGQWLPWLRDHCGIPDRTARHYMRLAKHEAEIGNLADLTLEQAVALISPAAPAEHWFERFVRECALIDERIVVTPVGLQLPEDPPLTFEEWKAVGRAIMTCCPMPDDFPHAERKAFLQLCKAG